MFSTLKAKATALCAFVGATASTAAMAQEANPIAALETAQATIEGNIYTAGEIMVALSVATIAAFFLYGVLRKRG